MRSCGIIAEFDPLHKGHLHLLSEAREMFPDAPIVCALSGDFLQRGTPSLFSKYERADAAVKAGADIVIEIPFPYSCRSAEHYAKCGVSLLKSAGCSDIIFGSECGDIDTLKAVADKISGISGEDIKSALKSGESYACAISSFLSPKETEIIEKPNNLLGIYYIRECGNGIIPHTIPRIPCRSASQIRESGDFSDIPFSLGEKFDNPQFEKALLFSLRQKSSSDVSGILGISEGIENRIFDAAFKTDSYNELLSMLVTKRYPLSRIRRTILYIALSVPRTFADIMPSYKRVLSFSERGRAYMKKGDFSVKTADMKLDANNRAIFDFSALAADIYRLFGGEKVCGRSDYLITPKYIKGEDKIG